MTAVTATWICTGGTVLATPAGAVAVQLLAPGMALATREGGTLRVATVGRVWMSAAELAGRPALWPVQVAAGALADAQGGRTCIVLPEQMLAVPGLPAVAAKWLVDGTGLRRDRPEAPVDFFSITTRDAGTPAGGWCVRDGETAAPRPADAVLHAVRRHIAARMGVVAGALRGSLDEIGRLRLAGWADDGSGWPVALELEVDGVPLPPMVAARHRQDLLAAGIGGGQRGFEMALDPGLHPRRRHLLRVRRALDGADLPGSPVLLDGAADLAGLFGQVSPDDGFRDAVAQAARMVAARIEASVAAADR